LRPGDEIVAGLGGIHGFMAWDGPILTDSGGYQVFSLDPRIDDDGVTFKSTYDGSTVELTPERAVEVQENLGADIAMVLDQLVGLPASRHEVEEAMARTLRWSERAMAAHSRTDQALFGIVQGGVDPGLRAESARRTAELGFPGFGIGGLSVGEAAADRNRAIEMTIENLPVDKVRYTMGLGDTEGILDAVARGVDLFDCVLPTRLARHGKALTKTGDVSIKRAEWAADPEPLDRECTCFTCRTHSRGYLRHLAVTGELLGQRLVTIHNLHYTLGLVAGARDAISAGRFDEWSTGVRLRRNGQAPLR